MAEYATPEDALAGELTGRAELPSRQAAVQIAAPAQNNADLARELVGLERGAPLPRKGTEARRRYDSTMRALQRAQAGPGKQYRPGTQIVRRLPERTMRAILSRRLISAARRGFNMAMRAAIRVSKIFRVHTMPARGVAGIPAQDAERIVDAWLDADDESAVSHLISSFFRSYWAGQGEPAELGTIEWVQLERA